MLEKQNIREILNEFLRNLEKTDFISFLIENEIYEEIEDFCEGLSIQLIEYKSQESEDISGHKDNSSTRRH